MRDEFFQLFRSIFFNPEKKNIIKVLTSTSSKIFTMQTYHGKFVDVLLSEAIILLKCSLLESKSKVNYEPALCTSLKYGVVTS